MYLRKIHFLYLVSDPSQFIFKVATTIYSLSEIMFIIAARDYGLGNTLSTTHNVTRLKTWIRVIKKRKLVVKWTDMGHSQQDGFCPEFFLV